MSDTNNATTADPTSGTILEAMNNMKTEFSIRFDGVLAATENMRQDITDCAEG